MITKSRFISSIEAVRSQIEFDRKSSEVLSDVFDSLGVFYNTSHSVEGLIDLLTDVMEDESGWIEYYIWELDFGRDYKDGMITIDGKNVRLLTMEHLWNLVYGNYIDKQNEK